MRELSAEEVKQVSGGELDQCPVPWSWTIGYAVDAWFRSWERDF